MCQHHKRYGPGAIFDGRQGGFNEVRPPPLGSTGLVARSVSMFFRVNARQAPIMNCRVKPTLARQGASFFGSKQKPGLLSGNYTKLTALRNMSSDASM